MVIILIAKDTSIDLARIFQAVAGARQARVFASANRAIKLLRQYPEEPSVVFYVADPSGLPLGDLDSFRAFNRCRVFLGFTAIPESGESYVRWLYRGVTDIFLPGAGEETIRHRMQWAIDEVAEPDYGSLVPMPSQGDVYLVLPYRPTHLMVMEKWVEPALRYAGYNGVLIKDHHGPSIRDTENHFAVNSSFGVVHLGKDEKENAIHNARVFAEIRTMVNHRKLIVGIRSSEERTLELPGDAKDFNCRDYDSEQELARWFYKVLTRKGNHAAGGNPDR